MTKHFSELLTSFGVCLEDFHFTQKYYNFSIMTQKNSGLLIISGYWKIDTKVQATPSRVPAL